MTEIAVAVASRYLKRKRSDAVGKHLLKTLTEPITNSDDSYRRITESKPGDEVTVSPITIFIDKPRRTVRIVDQAEGMSASELEKKFKEYGAAKSGAYEGFSSRGIFGQGLSDVLFYHKDGKIKTIKNDEATECRFYLKKDREYISVDKVKGAVNKIRQEWGVNKDGTVVEFTLDNTVLHDYENLIQKLRVFYMLRLINSNDRREIKLVYKDKHGTKESSIRYEFPKGDLVDSRRFSIEFENYSPVIADVQLYKSAEPLPVVGDERENGLLVYDEEEAVYDQTFFGLDDLPGADKFFGTMKLTGAREIVREKLNDPKHPEAILTDSRDGFNKQHDFYKKLALEVKDWLYPILSEERRRRTNDGISESIIERHQKAFEELNRLYKELTGEDVSGTIRSKKKTRPAGGLQFARNNISITAGKRYGLQLTIDTRVIKPGTKIILESSKKLIGFSPLEIEVEKARDGHEDLLVKTIVVTGSKARSVDTLKATADKRSASVVVSIVSEEVIYPENGIAFNPEYVRTLPGKDSVLNLYVDLTLVKRGTKVKLVSNNDTIVLAKRNTVVAGRMRSTPKVTKLEVAFRGNKDDETGIIEASVGDYRTSCRVDINKKRINPPPGVGGLVSNWDFDDGLSKNQQATIDLMEGSPTQGFLLINSSHPINKRYFGENPQKEEALQSQKAQLYVAELLLNEALGKMIVEAYQKGVIPQNYDPATDIPVYIAQKKHELGELIYSCFVDEEPSALEERRINRLEDAKQKSKMEEGELLANMEDRARVMVEMYFGLGEQAQYTLEEIGTKFEVTRERVRQIINKALAKAHAEKEHGELPTEEEIDARDYIQEEASRLKSEADLVVDVSARMYGVTPEELFEHSRRAAVVVPRQIAMYLLRTDLGLSFPSIGRRFDRDHTTVIHACNKIEEMTGKNERIRNRVEKVRKSIETINLRAFQTSQ